MLNHIHLLVLGGDHRYVNVMKAIAAKEANITAVGYKEATIDHSLIQCKQFVDVSFETADVVLLPVEGMDATGEIHAHDNNDTIFLTQEMINKTPKHCTIFTGTANDALREMVHKADRSLVVLFERDDIAIKNAIPTAEATLQIAMEETSRTIHHSNVLVIGYGRVGKTMARLFHQVGANVTVAARKDEDFARVDEMKFGATHINDLHHTLKNVNIIINTVPAPILQEKELTTIDPQTLIIDVASKPGGTDFKTAEKLGIRAIHALGLPGKVAPTTAGDILASVLTMLLERTR